MSRQSLVEKEEQRGPHTLPRLPSSIRSWLCYLCSFSFLPTYFPFTSDAQKACWLEFRCCVSHSPEEGQWLSHWNLMPGACSLVSVMLVSRAWRVSQRKAVWINVIWPTPDFPVIDVCLLGFIWAGTDPPNLSSSVCDPPQNNRLWNMLTFLVVDTGCPHTTKCQLFLMPLCSVTPLWGSA